MHRNLHSTTKLTEFDREWEEEPDTILGKIVNKLTSAYNTGYNAVNMTPNVEGGQIAIHSPRRPSDPSPGPSHSIPAVAATASMPIQPSGGSASNLSQVSAPISIISSTTTSTTSAGAVTNPSTHSDALDDTISMSNIEHVNANDTRTPMGILTRISSLVALTNNQLTNYRDTDLQKFWMPDAKSIECYECCQKFTTFRRKHHCRLCGQIFCAKCCSQKVPGKIIKCTGTLKVCTYCSKVVLSYLKSSDIQADLQSDLQALQEDLSSKLSDSIADVQPQGEHICGSPAKRKVSLGYQEERLTSFSHSSLSNADRKTILQQSNSLKTLYEEMSDSLPILNRGEDLILFLIKRQKASNRTQSVAILLAMIEAGFIVAVLADAIDIEFDAEKYFRLAQRDDLLMMTSSSSTNSFQLDLNMDENSVQLVRGGGGPSSTLNTPSTAMGRSQQEYPNQMGVASTPGCSLALSDNDIQSSLLSTVGSKPLLELFCSHEEQLIAQLLRSEGLDQKWAKILIPLCARLVNRVPATVAGLDIRSVVNFKKVPGGKRQESTIVGGIVISKNVAHKEMATHIVKPRILLLQCPIVHQRREGKYASLDILMMQEEEHLRNVTERIMCLKPNVILVHKNVARIAQDLLRDRGITLVLDVKLSVLERLARTLDCDLVNNIDSNIGRPRLGTCDLFKIRRFEDEVGGNGKTLMYFEVNASPKNCCVLLRGASNQELLHVKRVASFMAYARYNWRFELSLLLDLFAVPPLPKSDVFGDSTHDTSPVQAKGQQRENIINTTSIMSRSLLMENVQDFSDPLRNTELLANTIVHADDNLRLAVETPYDNRFKASLMSTVLSISPLVAFPLPYLETEAGRKCLLRKRFPMELYYSRQWDPDAPSTITNEKGFLQRTTSEPNDKLPEVKLNPTHPFVTHKITTSMDNKELQSLLARYRACGGRLPKTNKMMKPNKKASSPVKCVEDCKQDQQSRQPTDVLAIENHQRLPLLFCSYYSSPPQQVGTVNSTGGGTQKHSFCTQPLLLDMQFYGENDIMFGSFLEKYCFRFTYICKWCSLPMIGHSKRYVHAMGCIHVYITGEPKLVNDALSDTILVSTTCERCQETSPSVPLSQDSKCLSLAKYFEMRFHGHSYKRRHINVNGPTIDSLVTDAGSSSSSNRPFANDGDADETTCTHSLHRDHIHNFTSNGITAHFRYAPIQGWEIFLPPLIVRLPSPSLCTNIRGIQEEVKTLSQNGYEVYMRIYEKLAQLCSDIELPLVKSLKETLNNDQMMFKSRIEVVHTLLTEKVITMDEVNDAMLMAKRALAESIDEWGPRLHEAAGQIKILIKTESQSAIDAGTICTEELKGDRDEETEDHRSKHDSVDDNVFDAVATPQPPATSTNGGSSSSSSGQKTTVGSRKSLEEKKTVKSIWNQLVSSSGAINSIASPIPSNEHNSLPLGSFPIAVNDQDLSSIVAHTLVTGEYRRALEAMQTPSDGGPASPHLKRKTVEGSNSNNNNNNNNGDDGDEPQQEQVKSEEREKRNKSLSHTEVQFHDGTTNFTCKIYFAKEFEAIRNVCLRRETDQEQRGQAPVMIDNKGKINLDAWKLPEAEDIRKSFARSLSHSVPWDAKGGKSGSRFSKTVDKRFVLKEMSKTDVAIFENFGPNYFEYINSCLEMDQPTLLAKIFGVFKISIKKKDSEDKNVLVMENLFYDRNITNKFDLKGSERNRLADPINQQQGEIVLLDQNLMQMAWSNPLYILSHSRTVLRDTIHRDASFLERNDVMDYSLLVGLDSAENQLVLGIIDYIRTYTFDKKIESLVKQSGLLGGNGKAPTIINPKNYKQRFTEAMDKYFMMVPDRWQGLSKVP